MLVNRARQAIVGGQVDGLGPLMDENQRLLCVLDVSCAELDVLVQAARDAGASGAKLSGGGGGGNMIALARPESVDRVRQALVSAGAANVIITKVG